MEQVTILGVHIIAVTQTVLLRHLLELVTGSGKYHIVTVNSEMLVEASRNPQFFSILAHSSINTPDSIGLVWASQFVGTKLPERVAGVDMVNDLCLTLSADHPVFFLGGRDGVAEKAAALLSERNPLLRVAGTYEGNPREEDAEEIVERINQSGAHVLLVAFGAPIQDIWISEHISEMPHVRLAIGVGGTFDFIAAKRKRAPLFMQKIGLEWLWRLCLEPQRIGRIWRAVVVFPWFVVRFRENKPM
jgi:N-acetylglucosaminyldiphosphoundecaprenol N-acetyl-beta-D-mannosaminyltransferase